MGLLLSIRLFAIDVDLLAMPYINTPVTLAKDITIVQNDVEVSLPKGMKLNLVRRVNEECEYCIPLITLWEESGMFQEIAKNDYKKSRSEYFRIKK